ncbi:exosome complex component RRP4-like isoform X2 [Rhincodon typus]|uniref:exosome complex component RRP4-like isoform X2 n=1 Tax=Rhincodon typus TaxID=259920 RepID=UPI00202F718D|nr:exosome complex component RRP4-like isoform X2 [Rhincodon typus]
MAVDIRLATARKRVSLPAEVGKHLVSPGDTITTDTGFMRGHGTYMEDEKLIASVAGAVERVNKLICVKPLQTRCSRSDGKWRPTPDWTLYCFCHLLIFLEVNL